MRPTKLFRAILFALLAASFVSCHAGKFSGSANDRTGANGATNGTGQIAR